MFERLDGTVSLIEYSHSSIPHNTLYSLDFALQYVSKRIIIDNSRVVHLTPFLYDTQRSFNACKSALRNWRRHSSGSADINEEESGSVLYGRLNNTQVWQCVTLTDLQRILGELSVDVYSTTETRLCDVVLIEDLDEMFNIMTFKNPSQSTYPMISSKQKYEAYTNKFNSFSYSQRTYSGHHIIASKDLSAPRHNMLSTYYLLNYQLYQFFWISY